LFDPYWPVNWKTNEGVAVKGEGEAHDDLKKDKGKGN
jgi:hypothetical protein